jgi:2-polyprenyl-6-methoxyphenol hydroxylase-like FAD-dependent oxidoreductase
MSNHLGEQAIVIGGSIAGLATGRVLSDYFDNVTILERDLIEDRPAVHKSTPHGHQIHALLHGGLRAFESLYPQLTGLLLDSGAVPVRPGIDAAVFLPNGKFYSLVGELKEPCELGDVSYAQSRGLLEHSIRQLTRTLQNLSFLPQTNVSELVCTGGSVCGVKFQHQDRSTASEFLKADLVVDAGGRGSHASTWLRSIGFDEPQQTVIGSDFSYTGGKFRLRNGYLCEKMLMVPGRAPDFPKAAIVEQNEGDVWHMCLAGRFGDFPPTDEAGFLAFAKSLYTPAMYDFIVNSERVSDLTAHRFPTSIHRHYERLKRFPDGFLVIGDAICSFNPIYGQGMSSAALQAEALHQLLEQRVQDASGISGLARDFFSKAAEAIATPWALAAGADLAFPQTQGERPSDSQEAAAYFAALNRLAFEDLALVRLYTDVLGLLKPLSALFEEPLRSRVIARMQASQ